MAFSSILLRCLAKAAVKNVANLLTFGVGGDLLTDVWDAWSRRQDKASRKAEIEHLAAASPAEVRAAADQAVQQEDPTLLPVLREQVTEWLTQTPAAIRRSLRRPSDPSGRTLARGMTPTCAGDLAGLLPPRPPHFRRGDRPLPGVDLELEELLGVGGYGEVWKARNPHLASAKQVALKFCLDAQAASSLRHEAAMLDRVMRDGRHPGIVALQQTYLSADPPCLQYEYIDGGDLAGLIRDWHREGRADPEAITRLVLNLAGIVAFAHERGIVHRDLKPANILIKRAGDGKFRLRVADFGIGGVASRQAVDQARRDTSGTGGQATVARGAYTPLYASPQQVKGDKPDPRDDVYSLGVIWYQALTGHLDMGAPTGDAWRRRLAERGVSRELLKVLASCFEQESRNRPANAQVLAARIEEAVGPPPMTKVGCVPRDKPSEAAGWYRKATEQGDAAAQSNLGLCYQFGRGVATDLAEAARWYRKAAEQGDATAQNNLGYCYESGLGVTKDLAKAARWFRKAAEQGDATAQNNLGVCYTHGRGVATDLAEAARWYRKAAEQGDAAAQSNLGYCYESGLGVTKDLAKAARWFRKAADQGHSDAQKALDTLQKGGK
jgi:TPR repeat protein